MTVSINGVYSPTFKNGVLIKETISPDSETVNRGYYAATTLSAVDAELATDNIKSGITIFGLGVYQRSWLKTSVGSSRINTLLEYRRGRAPAR
ncbi:unnamed protein product [marine sediment metagenome]|uniref:Uncharacterized protein n=1 Tax=marine sediment metagenome TaxID=412755 RepID=X1UXT1_9ZZZZ